MLPKLARSFLGLLEADRRAQGEGPSGLSPVIMPTGSMRMRRSRPPAVPPRNRAGRTPSPTIAVGPTGPTVTFLAAEESLVARRDDADHPVTMAWHAVPVVGEAPARLALFGFRWVERPIRSWDPSLFVRCPDWARKIAELAEEG